MLQAPCPQKAWCWSLLVPNSARFAHAGRRPLHPSWRDTQHERRKIDMASGFSESGDGLHYAEHISVPMRLFVGAIALGMFLIPVPFVMHATARTPWLHLLLAAVCVVVA